MVASYQLTNALDIVGPLGILKTQPWAASALIAVRQIPRFNMVTAVLDGPTIAALASEPGVVAIYEDSPVNISQYSVAVPAATYAVRVPTAGQTQTMYFTSTDEVRSLVGADVANAAGYDGAGTTLAVVDTGGLRSQVQLRRMSETTVFPGNYLDVCGHGGWCLSAAAGSRVQDSQYSSLLGTPVYCEGMAPGCALVSVKSLDFVIGTGSTSQLLAGLDAAATANADVISLSWGSPAGPSVSDPFLPAVQQLVAEGRIVVAAAGNGGPGPATLDSPGSLEPVLTVGAYNAVTNATFGSGMFGAAGEVANFSSRGPTPDGATKPDCVAPGAILLSGVPVVSEMSVSYAHRPGQFSAIAGTSMATPIAAGLITCARQAWAAKVGTSLQTTEIKQMLSQLGQPKDDASGWGALTWGTFQEWAATEYGVTL